MTCPFGNNRQPCEGIQSRETLRHPAAIRRQALEDVLARWNPGYVATRDLTVCCRSLPHEPGNEMDVYPPGTSEEEPRMRSDLSRYRPGSHFSRLRTALPPEVAHAIDVVFCGLGDVPEIGELIRRAQGDPLMRWRAFANCLKAPRHHLPGDGVAENSRPRLPRKRRW
jgi:hypothetical protein